MDTKIKKLAKLIVNHSMNLQKGDKLVLSTSDFTFEDLIHEIYKLALQKGAFVYLDIFGTNYEIGRADYGGFYKTFMTHSQKYHLETPPKIMKSIIDWGDKFIRLTAIHDKSFLNEINPDKLTQWQKTYYPMFDEMIKKPWILTYLPTKALAKASNMSLEKFTDFYFDACLVDYDKMNEDIKNLEKVLDKGNTVAIKGDNIDITFDIKTRLAEGGNSGKHNIPDGECFIAPIETGTNGYVKFEYPQVYQGQEVSDIELWFKDGKVVKFDASKNKTMLESIFNQHSDNKRVGELGIGMNKNITKYIKDILFDEKIYGTIHMALGRSYTEKRGGGNNKGTIHWDLIKDLHHKGSYIKIDDVIIAKDGEILI